ncbi:MAG: NPCBM/NEW2 domain-containing protein [Isosphaeraceae bacterium]
MGEPMFRLLTTTGESVGGRIKALAPTGAVTLVANTGQERVIPFDSVVKLTREEGRRSGPPEAALLLFPDGDHLDRASIGAASDTHVDVQSYSLGSISVPLDSLIGLIFSVPTNLEEIHAGLSRVRDDQRTTEVLWLANNDRLSIGLLGFSEKTIEYQAEKRKQSIERTRVVALGFDPKLVTYPRPETGFYELTLTDGSRIGVSIIGWEKGTLHAKTRFGVTLKVPALEISRLRGRSTSIEYLTDRTPAREVDVPYIGPARSMRRDLSVDGLPIRLGGEEFDRGLGTMSRTLLAYRLAPGDLRFQAQVGVNERAGPQGNAQFRVMVDGQEKFASPKMASGDPPSTVDLDLEGAKLLILITEYGDRGGVRDLADWAEARIIRRANP